MRPRLLFGPTLPQPSQASMLVPAAAESGRPMRSPPTLSASLSPSAQSLVTTTPECQLCAHTLAPPGTLGSRPGAACQSLDTIATHPILRLLLLPAQPWGAAGRMELALRGATARLALLLTPSASHSRSGESLSAGSHERSGRLRSQRGRSGVRRGPSQRMCMQGNQLG